MVRCQHQAQGQLRLNINSYMLNEEHLCLRNRNCTQLTAQQDA
jgi:hypothetical protein